MSTGLSHCQDHCAHEPRHGTRGRSSRQGPVRVRALPFPIHMLGHQRLSGDTGTHYTSAVAVQGRHTLKPEPISKGPQQSPDSSSPLLPLFWSWCLSCLFGLSDKEPMFQEKQTEYSPCCLTGVIRSGQRNKPGVWTYPLIPLSWPSCLGSGDGHQTWWQSGTHSQGHPNASTTL